MIVNLVEKNGRGTSGVGFPFGGPDNGKPEPFPAPRMEEGIKKKLTAAQWERVLFYEPHPGGSVPLWAINEIANADKHRKGLVEIKVQIKESTSFGAGNFRYRFPEDNAILGDEEGEEVLVSFTTAVEPQIQHNIAAAIVFSNVPPVQGKDVLVTLNFLNRLTKSVIKDFDRRFF